MADQARELLAVTQADRELFNEIAFCEGWECLEADVLDGKWDHDWSMQAIARHRIGVSKAKWVTAEFWADLEGGDPDDFAAGWYEPNAEDELCANIWTPLPAPPATLPRSSVSEQRTEVERLREALHNLIVLARPHFSDPTQMLALKQAQEALATLVSSSNPDGGGVR